MIYATPQTLLNDLINGHVDALDIVLIVIGERRTTPRPTFDELTRLV